MCYQAILSTEYDKNHAKLLLKGGVDTVKQIC